MDISTFIWVGTTKTISCIHRRRMKNNNNNASMVSEIIPRVTIFHLGGSGFFIKWVEDPVTTMTMNPRVFSNHSRYIATQYFPDGIGTLMDLKDTEHADTHDILAVWCTLGSFGVAKTSETPSMGLSLKTWVWSLIWEELLAYISFPDTVFLCVLCTAEVQQPVQFTEQRLLSCPIIQHPTVF